MVIDHPSQEQTGQLLELWKDVFGEHQGFWEMFLDTAWSFDRCRCITAEGKVTASLCWLDTWCEGQKLAYLYAVVTHPAFRRRGLFRSLMADTHEFLQQKGYDGVLLVPAQESLRELYGTFGYRNCGGISEVVCQAGKMPVNLRAIGPEEYIRLRRQHLPSCGVVQEGENLTFLAAQAQFYAGEDFLLAAWEEEQQLHGMELLGNAAAAPGILHTLGCRKGTFRIPGRERPFAMFLPLNQGAKAPEYFGFAFD